MKKLRALAICGIVLGSLVFPTSSAHAQYCQPDDFDVNCQAQRACEKLADKSQLFSCTH